MNTQRRILSALLLASGAIITAVADHSDRANAAEGTLAAPNPSAGQVEHVTVRVTGEGASVTAAVDQAIQLAIEQVNGKTLSASSVQFQGGMAVAVGSQHVDVSSSAFANLVATHTQGAVSEFRLVSQTPTSAQGLVSVTIEAKVAKFVAPESASRLRLVVAPLRSHSASFSVDSAQITAGDLEQQLQQSLTNALTQTGRLAILDREFGAEVDSEMDLIASGKVAHEDFARLGHQLAADYLLVGQIDRFGYERHERAMRTSDRTIVSYTGGAALTLRLVNVATGQVEQAETVAISAPETNPTTLGTTVNTKEVADTLENRLAEETAHRIMARLFPVTILAVDGADVVLSQGGKSVVEGQQYQVVALGKELKDPQTGQSLGRIDKPCCTVAITRVTAQLSYGHVVTSQMDVAAAFRPGALELRDAVVSLPRATKAAASAPGDPTAPPKPASAVPTPAKPSTADKDW